MKKFRFGVAICVIITVLATIMPVQAQAASKAKAPKLSETSVSLGLGKNNNTCTLSVKNKTGYSVKWSSSDKTVAKVSKGKVTAVSEGKCKITAKLTSKNDADAAPIKLKATVTVTKGGGSVEDLVVAEYDFVDKNGAKQTKATKDYNVPGLNFTKTLDYNTEDSWMTEYFENELAWSIEHGAHFDTDDAQLPILDKANTNAVSGTKSLFGMDITDEKGNQEALNKWMNAANIDKSERTSAWDFLGLHNGFLYSSNGSDEWEICVQNSTMGGFNGSVYMKSVYLKEFDCYAVQIESDSFWNMKHFTEAECFRDSSSIIYCLSLISAYPQEVFDVIYGNSSEADKISKNMKLNEWYKINDVYVYWDSTDALATSNSGACNAYFIPVNE